jgi:uncharacterized protein YukE
MAMAVQKMDYDQADEMIFQLRSSAEQIEELMRMVQQIAGKMDEGALVGRGGTAFTSALRERFSPALQRLSEKLKEQAEYVLTEKHDMMEAERRNTSLFK